MNYYSLRILAREGVNSHWHVRTHRPQLRVVRFMRGSILANVLIMLSHAEGTACRRIKIQIGTMKLPLGTVETSRQVLVAFDSSLFASPTTQMGISMLSP